MWDRLFGRNNDDNLEPCCATCGRTLLPGEWAQTVVADNGREEIICSLCAQSGAAAEHAAPDQAASLEPAPPVTVSGRPQPIKPRPQTPRNESDAFWRALKEKDTEIGRLQSELVRAEAEKQELAAQVGLLLRQLRGEAITDWQSMAVFPPEESVAAVPAAAASLGQATQPLEIAPEPAEAALDLAGPAFAPRETALETPAQTAEMPALAATEATAEPQGPSVPETSTEAEYDQTAALALPAVQSSGAIPVLEEGPSWLFETPPHQTFGGDRPVMPDQEEPERSAAGAAAEPGTASVAVAASAPLFHEELSAEPLGEALSQEAEPEPELPAPSQEEMAAEAAQLTLLQRGADLLNVSPVSHKVSETSESLGMPLVGLSSDGESMKAVFLWSMAWYTYRVDLSTGEVELLERGYDDRPDLRPNARVRADGTVQVAPPPTRRPAPVAQPAPPARPAPEPGPGNPRVADSAKADIISKSLKGQRTDDAQSWDQMSARDFDWGS